MTNRMALRRQFDEIFVCLARLESATLAESPHFETDVQAADRWKLQQELAQMRKERDEARRERDHENAKYEEAAYNLRNYLASVELSKAKLRPL